MSSKHTISLPKMEFIDAVEIIPSSAPAFPGYQTAYKTAATFTLPTILRCRFSEPTPYELELNYLDCLKVLLMEYDQSLITHHDGIDKMLNTLALRADDSLSQFKAELMLVASRFLHVYPASASEIYQSLLTFELRVESLWNLFNVPRRSIVSVFKDDKPAKPYLSMLILVVISQYKLDVVSLETLDVLSKYTVNKKKESKNYDQVGGADRLHKSVALDKRISVEVIRDEPKLLTPPLFESSILKHPTGGIIVTIDNDNSVTLNVFDLMQCVIGLVKPTKWVESPAGDDDELFNALRARAYHYFLTQPLHRSTIAAILFAFFQFPDYYLPIGIKPVTFFTPPESIEEDTSEVAWPILITLPYMVLNGQGSPLAFQIYQ